MYPIVIIVIFLSMMKRYININSAYITNLPVFNEHTGIFVYIAKKI